MDITWTDISSHLCLYCFDQPTSFLFPSIGTDSPKLVGAFNMLRHFPRNLRDGFHQRNFWDILGYFESVEGSTSLQREPRWCLPRSWLELVRTGYGPSQEWSGHLWVIFFSKLLNHSMKNGRLFSRWLSSNCGVRPVEFKSTQWHQAPDRDDGCKQETCVSIAFRRVDPKKIRDLPKQ